MQNSKYNPLKNDEMTKQNLNFNAKGVQSLNITAGIATNLDLKLTDDTLFTGASVIVKDGTFGDKFHVQIVDVDGAFYPAGAVLVQPITDWGIITDKQDQGSLETRYPAKIPAGLYLRFKYFSTGTVSPSIIINYHLHKILS